MGGIYELVYKYRNNIHVHHLGFLILKKEFHFILFYFIFFFKENFSRKTEFRFEIKLRTISSSYRCGNKSLSDLSSSAHEHTERERKECLTDTAGHTRREKKKKRRPPLASSQITHHLIISILFLPPLWGERPPFQLTGIEIMMDGRIFSSETLQIRTA